MREKSQKIGEIIVSGELFIHIRNLGFQGFIFPLESRQALGLSAGTGDLCFKLLDLCSPVLNFCFHGLDPDCPVNIAEGEGKEDAAHDHFLLFGTEGRGAHVILSLSCRSVLIIAGEGEGGDRAVVIDRPDLG